MSHGLCEEKLERYDRPEVNRHQIRADTERANLPVDLLSHLHLHVADTTQSLSLGLGCHRESSLGLLCLTHLMMSLTS